MKQKIKVIGKNIGIGIIIILILTLPHWHYYVFWEPTYEDFEGGIYTLEDKIQDMRRAPIFYSGKWWVAGLFTGGIIVLVLLSYKNNKS